LDSLFKQRDLSRVQPVEQVQTLLDQLITIIEGQVQQEFGERVAFVSSFELSLLYIVLSQGKQIVQSFPGYPTAGIIYNIYI